MRIVLFTLLLAGCAGQTRVISDNDRLVIDTDDKVGMFVQPNAILHVRDDDPLTRFVFFDADGDEVIVVDLEKKTVSVSPKYRADEAAKLMFEAMRVRINCGAK